MLSLTESKKSTISSISLWLMSPFCDNSTTLFLLSATIFLKWACEYYDSIIKSATIYKSISHIQSLLFLLPLRILRLSHLFPNLLLRTNPAKKIRNHLRIDVLTLIQTHLPHHVSIRIRRRSQRLHRTLVWLYSRRTQNFNGSLVDRTACLHRDGSCRRCRAGGRARGYLQIDGIGMESDMPDGGRLAAGAEEVAHMSR